MGMVIRAMEDYSYYQNNDMEVYTVRTSRRQYINYCYVVQDKETKQILVIDPSWELDKLEEVINKLGGKLSMILLTHSHYDHTNLANDLYIAYRANCYMSKNEIIRYEYRGLGLMGVQDGEVLELGNTKITCLLTPGHTEGSMCFLIHDCIFTGDTLYYEGCGICDVEGSNPEKMFDSLQMLKKIIKPNDKVFPAHAFVTLPGKCFSDICDDNIYLNIDEKDDFVEFRMRPQKVRPAFI